MFWISVLFLANTATSIVLWVDVPRVRAGMPEVGSLVNEFQSVTLAAAIAMWPIFILEFLFYFFSATDGRKYTGIGLAACFCPPLRLAAPNLEMRDRIWFPKYGWTRPTSCVRRQLERQFSVPMIMIALMILPILLVEFGFKEQIMTRNWLRILLHVSTGTIWFAFAFEFIVMFSVAPKKWRYCKVHWLDLAIVLLPLISFIRSLRVLRATRLGRLAKIQQLTRLGRVYRMRGLAIKAFRGLAIFEVMNRLLRITPERQVEMLKEQLAEFETEAREIRRRIASIEQMIACDEEEERKESSSKVEERSQGEERSQEKRVQGKGVRIEEASAEFE